MRASEEKHGVSSPSNKLENGRNCVRHLLRGGKMTHGLRGGEPLRVLDFGCRWGQLLPATALFGAEAHGVDRDVDRLNEASGRGVKVASGLDALPSSLRGRLDAISLFQVLEHLEEAVPCWRNCASGSGPSGPLILETPTCTGVRGFDSADSYRDINPLAHINAFTPQALVEIARRAGYVPANYVAAQRRRCPRCQVDARGFVAAARTQAAAEHGTLLPAARAFRRSGRCLTRASRRGVPGCVPDPKRNRASTRERLVKHGSLSRNRQGAGNSLEVPSNSQMAEDAKLPKNCASSLN